MNRVRLSARELLDLRSWLELDQPIDSENEASVNAARRVVLHYIEAFESGDEINPLALLYIMQALRRTVAADDGDLGKELGIKRIRAGNPGGLSRKRRLTPGDKEEIPIEFERRIKHDGPQKRTRGEGSIRNRVVGELAAENRVAVRTVENCLKDDKDRREAAEEVIERHSKAE